MIGSEKLGVNPRVRVYSEMDEAGSKIEDFLRSAPYKTGG